MLDDDKRLLRVSAGDPEDAFQDLVAFARSVYEVPIPQQYDIAIGGAGFPKDSNLYQASRAPSYLFFAPTCVIRPGGYFIIPARCEEGAGSGVGEQRFLSAMRDMPDVALILEDARLQRISSGAAASICNGESAGKDACHNCRKRVSRKLSPPAK